MHRSLDRVAAMAALVVICGALAGPVSPVFAHGPDPVLGGKPFGQDQVLKFSWRTGSVPIAAIATAIKAAAVDATATRNSRAASIAYTATGGNPIGYGAGATCGVNGLACFTRNAPTGFTMWLREQGHVFDWGTLKWCQTYPTPPNGCYDAETIALDEFGHVEMLDHHVNLADASDYEDAVVQTFSRTKPQLGWDMHGFGTCDVATLQRQYDMTSWASKYSSCGPLPTTLTLAVPATVVYNGSVTAVATLRVADDAAYGRLALNPVAGRIVTLQARSPGTSTWLTVGTMAVGSSSGTYTRALALTADIQLRATFKTPTDEGLRASTSATATIDVGACRTAPCPSSPERR